MTRLSVNPLLVVVAILASAPNAAADSFGSGANSFEIEFVTIDHPGNPPDTTGSPNPAGSVPYAYRIGKYEISEQMIDKANALGGLGITIDVRGPDKPGTSVSWFEAAQFVNWLNTSSGGTPAYKFDSGANFQLWEPSDGGYDASNRFRNSQATYFLPSANEWYKAAYYDPNASLYWDYATGSDTPPIAVSSGTSPGTAVYQQGLAVGPAEIMQSGGMSPYGTLGQGGNVEEWEETALDLINNDVAEMRGRRGGFWEFSALSAPFRNASDPSTSIFGVGFRIASAIPEPNAAVLIAAFFLGMPATQRRLRLSASKSV